MTMTDSEKKPMSAQVFEIPGAYRDLNSRGRGTEAFRKVLRAGHWNWVATQRLRTGTFRAADRRDQVTGPVETGEIVAQFSRHLPDRRCSLDWFCAVADDGGLIECKYSRTKIGGVFGYKVELPDGSTIDVTDPMAR